MIDYLQVASSQAKAYRDQILKARQADFASSVVVVPLLIGPDNQTLVPCGQHSFARAVADQFEQGRLTITAIDDGSDVRIYEPGTWAEATVYGPDSHILYAFRAEGR